MNAADDRLAEVIIELLPITAIRPSMTHIQQLRRKRFDPAKLLELADSIKTQGLLQPILVRPVAPDGVVQYELVAGERRWIAADRAGTAHIAANIRSMSDGQVLEAQLVENLQREDVHPLEESEGYRELMELNHLKADAIAELIGKSKGYFYARLKLLKLCPEAREAMETGDLDASKGLLLARISGERLQKKALKIVQSEGEYFSYRRLVEKLRDNFMVSLAGAPFSLDDDATEVTVGKKTYELNGACMACPHNSDNDPELKASLKDSERVCTERQCYDHKITIFWGKQRLTAEQEGRTVLTGAEAKAAIPGEWRGINDRYLDLDAVCEDAEFPEPEPKDDSPEWGAWYKRSEEWQRPAYREIFAGIKVQTVIAEGNKGKAHELVAVKDAAKALKAKGIKLDIPGPQRQMSMPAADNEDMKRQRELQEARQEREIELRRRVLTQIHAKWKPPFKRVDLEAIAEVVCNGYERHVEFLFDGKKPLLTKMTEAELARTIMEYTVAAALAGYGSPARLFTLAKRCKVDPEKIKKEIAAEARAKAKPPAIAATPAKPTRKTSKK